MIEASVSTVLPWSLDMAPQPPVLFSQLWYVGLGHVASKCQWNMSRAAACCFQAEE